MDLKKLLSFLICFNVALYGFARDTGEMVQTNDDKGKFDMETLLRDASSGFSNVVSVEGKTEGNATCLAFSRHTEGYYDLLKSYPRLTTDYKGRLTISFIGVETIPNYVSQEGVALSYKMAGESMERLSRRPRKVSPNTRHGGKASHGKKVGRKTTGS